VKSFPTSRPAPLVKTSVSLLGAGGVLCLWWGRMFPNGRNEFRFSVQRGQRKSKGDERDKRRTLFKRPCHIFLF